MTMIERNQPLLSIDFYINDGVVGMKINKCNTLYKLPERDIHYIASNGYIITNHDIDYRLGINIDSDVIKLPLCWKILSQLNESLHEWSSLGYPSKSNGSRNHSINKTYKVWY